MSPPMSAPRAHTRNRLGKLSLFLYFIYLFISSNFLSFCTLFIYLSLQQAHVPQLQSEGHWTQSKNEVHPVDGYRPGR